MELEIRDISKMYANGVHALKDINLTISKSMFGLLGPNGAGKSSIMRTIATLQTPDSGKIYFDGQDIFTNPTEFRCQPGYLPQDFGVYANASATDMLDHFARLEGIYNAKERKMNCWSWLTSQSIVIRR
ncbi:hypothetical protein CKO50_16705 [Pseudoalteromonas sp. HM-SA03]|uniref:ATP-binding cassette domain-containing protein n=1 Tax=Pseudoalteromonas sp. HM-SA03 TaxID=2029678 RepID=UPI000BADF721|nr:ATP-binding cassette domain-containing protein [Pseudoalteromonas sp. HM-SA03]PAY00182.1 hypothetical protein CKO50_16705 [Pseudoalteromonas sp. HM-SA03]